MWRDVFVRADVPDSLLLRARAALVLHPDAVLVGLAAAAVWMSRGVRSARWWALRWEGGLDVRGDLGVEVAGTSSPVACVEIVLEGGGRSVPGLRVRRDTLSPDEVVECDGLRLTNPTRTVLDCARRLPEDDAVVVADALGRCHEVRGEEVQALVARHAGVRGLSRVREVMAASHPGSTSALRTRLRLLLVHAGLPVPLVDALVTDREGALVAAADLVWEQERSALYCGAEPAEVERWSEPLWKARWTVLAVDEHDVLDRSDHVVTVVGGVLRASPAGTRRKARWATADSSPAGRRAATHAAEDGRGRRTRAS